MSPLLKLIFHLGVHFRMVVLHIRHLLHKVFIWTQHGPVAFTGKGTLLTKRSRALSAMTGLRKRGYQYLGARLAVTIRELV